MGQDKDINGEDIFHQVASHAPAHILKAGGRLGGLMQGCKCGVWGESHQGSRTTKLNKPFRRLTGRSLMGTRTTPSLFPFLSSAHSVALCLLSWTAVKEQFDIENITDVIWPRSWNSASARTCPSWLKTLARLEF